MAQCDTHSHCIMSSCFGWCCLFFFGLHCNNYKIESVWETQKDQEWIIWKCLRNFWPCAVKKSLRVSVCLNKVSLVKMPAHPGIQNAGMLYLKEHNTVSGDLVVHVLSQHTPSRVPGTTQREYRIQNTEYRIQNAEYRIQNTEYRGENEANQRTWGL